LTARDGVEETVLLYVAQEMVMCRVTSTVIQMIFRYYYYNDEGQDNGMGMRATGDYLEQAALNLSAIFQVTI
jgi:hypothetical protein